MVKISRDRHNGESSVFLKGSDRQETHVQCGVILEAPHSTPAVFQTPPRADFCIGVAGLRPLDRIASRLRALRKARALATTMSV